MSSNAFGPLSNLAIEMAVVIKRPGTIPSKLGALREAVGKGYAGFDRARRDIQRS